jgi:hypothetical protein
MASFHPRAFGEGVRQVSGVDGLNAAILCPGPSLQSCGAISADVTIGINRAASFVPCDWVAAVDYPVVTQWGDSFGGAKWLTNQNSITHLEREKHPWAWREHVTTDFLRRNFHDTRDFPWTIFSFTSALVFAAYLGATTVEIYGADWAGVADWDGVESAEPGKRDEQRWDGERKLFHKVESWMQSKGITVTRHVRIG